MLLIALLSLPVLQHVTIKNVSARVLSQGHSSEIELCLLIVSMHTAIKINKGLIKPYFDNCSAVRDGLTQQLSEKHQNRAVRVITKSSYDTSSRFLLHLLGWDNLSVRRAKQKANLMYKCINNLTPAYFCNLFAPRTPNYYFSQREENINAPKTKNWLHEAKLQLQWRSSMEQFSRGNTYIKFFKLLSEKYPYVVFWSLLPHGKYVKQFLRICYWFSLLNWCF